VHTDVAMIGPDNAETILVVSSGTHGVEGFAGAGIQIGLLKEGIASRLKPTTAIVMIHAINPYGFSRVRRYNEDNVDLNRNFIDYSKPHPKNKGYEELADAIAPETISVWENLKSRLHLLWYRFRKGTLELRRAISSGQYTHPEGLFYGGRSDTWSNRTVREIAERYLSDAKRVVVVDVHTGLGAYGNAEIILNVPEDSEEYQRARKWWGNQVRTTVSGKSVSVHVQGSLKLAFDDMLPKTEVTAVSLEFGTSPPKEVFWALRAENWFHHHGGKDHPDKREVKADLLRVFYPDTTEWKLQVWKQGKEVVRQALDKLQ
jgi:hypothetical protein